MITSFSSFNGATFEIFMNMTQCNVLIFHPAVMLIGIIITEPIVITFTCSVFMCQDPATRFNITAVLPGRGISIIKIRRP